MKYRRFGKTEIQMPVLTLGCMRFQQAWQDKDWDEIEEANQANLEATLAHALELGINHIETARGYGTSEMQIGRFLKKLDRDSYILQSKVAPAKDNHEFQNNVEKTFSYLGVEVIDLFTIHGVNNRECAQWAMQKGGALDQAVKLQKEGRIKHIGFTSHAPPPLILELIETNAFSFVNLHYYYINQATEICVQAAQKRDMGLLVISPNDKGGHLWKNPTEMAELTAPLHPMQFNSLFCLQHAGVHTLTMGAAQPSDLDLHEKALDHYDQRDELIPPMVENLDHQIAMRFGADWLTNYQKNIPYYYDTPGEVNVWEILRILTYGKGLGLESFAKARYNMLGKSGHWFPGQNAQNFDEEAILKVCADNPYGYEIPMRLREANRLFGDEEIAKKAGPQSSHSS